MYSSLHDVDTLQNLTLSDLSRKKASEMTLSVVYLVIIIIVGMVGNGLVLKVYSCFRSSTHRIFILVLAFYDFLACGVGAPLCIVEFFFAFTYTDDASCRIFRFILYYTCIASSLTLVLISIERFRKICRPLKTQMTVTGAKKAIFVVVGIVSTASASPALVLYGRSSILTGYRNMTGTKCFISDTFQSTMWPTAFNVYLLALALVSTACMATCYICIARQVAKMGQSKDKEQKASTCDNNDNQPIRMVDIVEHAVFEFNSDQKSPNSFMTSESITETPMLRKADSNSLSASKWRNAKKIFRTLSSKSGRRTLRITKMLTLVTVAFMVSYTPHLTLMLWSMFTKDHSSLPTNNVYHLIFYSFFINNLVNPLIYAAMDTKFRRELGKTFITKR